MTGYYITLGYNSGYSCVGTDKPEALQVAAESIARDTARLIAEVKRVDPRAGSWTDDTLREYAAAYTKREDLTLTISEGKVSQLASGGMDSRLIKEAFRRAFCRLLIEDMHRLGIEVNLEVV